MIPPFETTFAVPLSCESCIKDVETSLYKLDGIHKVTADLKAQLIAVEGTSAPSSIVTAIQDTGRTAILRGSGREDGAAVCILETHSKSVRDPVRGLIRMVEVTPTLTVVDLTIKGLSEGLYHVTVRQGGVINDGAESTGGIWDAAPIKAAAIESNGEPNITQLITKVEEARKTEEVKKAFQARGYWGTVTINKNGIGSVFWSKPFQVVELFGKSIVVSKNIGETPVKIVNEQEIYLPDSKEDPDTLVGVIARSSGAWGNDKAVCSCSGKTVWEEREEQTAKGML